MRLALRISSAFFGEILPLPKKDDQVSKPYPGLSGETFSSESRRACAWDRRSPA
jgi:hypothetical protein